jgi:ElaB/YqjD/DUF883 family membrane-anchored ribosome-binding protein
MSMSLASAPRADRVAAIDAAPAFFPPPFVHPQEPAMSDFPYPSSPALTPSSDGPAKPGNGAGLHQPALTDRMAQGAHHTIDRLAETTAPHLQRLEEAVTGAGVQLKKQARQAREAGDEWAEGLRTGVRRNPLAAVAIALAMGALISRLTR